MFNVTRDMPNKNVLHYFEFTDVNISNTFSNELQQLIYKIAYVNVY